MNLDGASEAEKEILYNMLFKGPDANQPQNPLFEHLKSPVPTEPTVQPVATAATGAGEGDPAASQQEFREASGQNNIQHPFVISGAVPCLPHDQNGSQPVPVTQQQPQQQQCKLSITEVRLC